MIGKPVLRVVALLATLGQLQQLPAAVACAEHHARPVAAGHCGSSTPLPGGPSVAAGQDTGPVTCAGTPCLAQAPAITGSAGVAAAPLAFPLPVAALPSVTSVTFSPPSPPPQA